MEIVFLNNLQQQNLKDPVMKTDVFFAAALICLSPGLAWAEPPSHSAAQEHRRDRPAGPAVGRTMSPEQIISNWKPDARAAAQRTLSQYGRPDETTEQRLIWHDNGPWKRTEVVNQEIPHNFPMPHHDMLYQTINYQVPADKTDELAHFTGSVIVDQVRGELTARCDKEAANFLSLNLSNRIVQDEIDVQEARRIYAEAMIEDRHADLKSQFAFQVPERPQGDPGEAHAIFAGRREQDQQPRR